MSGFYDEKHKNTPVLNNIEGWCSACKQPRVWHECRSCTGWGLDFELVTDDDGNEISESFGCLACAGDGGEYRCPTCNSSGRAARMMAEESGVQW